MTMFADRRQQLAVARQQWQSTQASLQSTHPATAEHSFYQAQQNRLKSEITGLLLNLAIERGRNVILEPALLNPDGDFARQMSGEVA